MESTGRLPDKALLFLTQFIISILFAVTAFTGIASDGDDSSL